MKVRLVLEEDSMNLLHILKDIIISLGYGGIFIATGLEYACFPVSSEILLPLIGYTIAAGEMNLIFSIFISTFAGTLGSLFCYMMGRLGGTFLEQTLCKRFETLQIGMDKAKHVFEQYGKISVLLGRMFPIARTYISFPAGMTSMRVTTFLIYTAIGAFCWNTILISCGYFLGKNWKYVISFYSNHEWILTLAIGLIFIFIVFHIRKKRMKNFSKKGTKSSISIANKKNM